MHLLISNDDGITAIGLKHLASRLKSQYRVTVIAPDRDLSGSSHALTLSRPIQVMAQENGHFAVDGTPADCVYLGINGAFDQHVDMVVSGINMGSNLGDDVLYSGTVAAAMEGRFLSHTAMAVSLVGNTHYATAADIALQLVQKIDSINLPERCMLNVNVPDLPLAQIKGFKATWLGRRHMGAAAMNAFEPRGKSCYWIGPVGAIDDAAPGTDFHAVEHGYVSITPLAPDMFSQAALEPLTQWLDPQP
jgi:5'-nucleotidase